MSLSTVTAWGRSNPISSMNETNASRNSGRSTRQAKESPIIVVSCDKESCSRCLRSRSAARKVASSTRFVVLLSLSTVTACVKPNPISVMKEANASQNSGRSTRHAKDPFISVVSCGTDRFSLCFRLTNAVRKPASSTRLVVPQSFSTVTACESEKFMSSTNVTSASRNSRRSTRHAKEPPISVVSWDTERFSRCFKSTSAARKAASSTRLVVPPSLSTVTVCDGEKPKTRTKSTSASR